jgi:glycerol-3-phosphate dehydrogenase subunit B
VQQAVADQIRKKAGPAHLVGVPAVFGIQDSVSVLNNLKKQTGLPFFEIPGVWPSVPGMRLKNGFEAVLDRLGVQVLTNLLIQDPVFNGRTFTFTARGQGGYPSLTLKARGVILATGRFFGNGLHARRERIVETVFRLNVVQPVRRSLWHSQDFLDPRGHGINQAGVETDDRFRPLDERGQPVFPTLHAAGSILAHNDWPRLKSGSGVCLVSGCGAADALAACLGKTES